jgi:5-methylcytosine-specific restriction endonuclease McrA
MANAIRIRAYHRDKEPFKRSRKKYFTKHWAKVAASRKAYKLRNVENERRVQRRVRQAYYKRNKAKWINFKLVRRARERTTPEEMAKCEAFISTARARKVKTCYYCGSDFRETPHIDHVIPLAGGGKHELSNLCTSCDACNLAKGAKQPNQFTSSGQSFLPL